MSFIFLSSDGLPLLILEELPLPGLTCYQLVETLLLRARFSNASQRIWSPHQQL